MAARRGALVRVFNALLQKAPLASEANLGEIDDLGPFRPPADFDFEPELCAPVPRQLPSDVRQREIIIWRRAAAICATIGGLLFAAAPLTLVQRCAQFVPMLAHLSWIGVAMLAIAAVLQVGSSHAPVRNHRYFELGTPIVVRVCRLWMQPGILRHGQPFFYHFFAVIDYPDFTYGVMRRQIVASVEIPASTKDRHETTYRVGDYATALELSNDDLNLYGFLNLTPGFGVLDRGETGQPPDPPVRSDGRRFGCRRFDSCLGGLQH